MTFGGTLNTQLGVIDYKDSNVINRNKFVLYFNAGLELRVGYNYKSYNKKNETKLD